MFMPMPAKLPLGSATVCQAGGVPAAVSHAQRASGGATVTRPVSSIALTAIHA